MSKVKANMNFNPDIWESFKKVYPNQASKILEEYMKSLLSVKDLIPQTENSEELQDALRDADATIQKANLARAAIQAKIYEYQKLAAQREQQRLVQEQEKAQSKFEEESKKKAFIEDEIAAAEEIRMAGRDRDLRTAKAEMRAKGIDLTNRQFVQYGMNVVDVMWNIEKIRKGSQ